MGIVFTPRAREILTKTAAAARRFNPDALVRASRAGGDEVVFGLTDAAQDGDLRIEEDGFTLLVEAGLEGTVDIVEPHDRLVLLAPR